MQIKIKFLAVALTLIVLLTGCSEPQRTFCSICGTETSGGISGTLDYLTGLGIPASKCTGNTINPKYSTNSVTIYHAYICDSCLKETGVPIARLP